MFVGFLQCLVRRQCDLSRWRRDVEEYFRPVGQHSGHERVWCALSCAIVHRPQDPRGKDRFMSSPCFRKSPGCWSNLSHLYFSGSLVQCSVQRQRVPTRDCTERWSCGETGMRVLSIMLQHGIRHLFSITFGDDSNEGLFLVVFRTLLFWLLT